MGSGTATHGSQGCRIRRRAFPAGRRPWGMRTATEWQQRGPWLKLRSALEMETILHGFNLPSSSSHTMCFTWIWEDLLMEFVNAFVRRRTVDIEAAMRNAKIDFESRICQLEHKLEIASSDLAAVTARLEFSVAEARSTASLLKARKTNITRMRLVMIGCLLVWFFSVKREALPPF